MMTVFMTDEFGDLQRVETDYDPKPIPIRDFDWSAYFPDSYDEDEWALVGPTGHGRTEATAIADLAKRIDDKR